MGEQGAPSPQERITNYIHSRGEISRERGGETEKTRDWEFGNDFFYTTSVDLFILKKRAGMCHDMNYDLKLCLSEFYEQRISKTF
jgi:hypothetical protein